MLSLDSFFLSIRILLIDKRVEGNVSNSVFTRIRFSQIGTSINQPKLSPTAPSLQPVVRLVHIHMQSLLIETIRST